MSRVYVIMSWTLYYAGDLWWRATDWLGEWFEWPYRGYQNLMCWADYWQGDDPRGHWQNAETSTDGD